MSRIIIKRVPVDRQVSPLRRAGGSLTREDLELNDFLRFEGDLYAEWLSFENEYALFEPRKKSNGKNNKRVPK